METNDLSDDGTFPATELDRFLCGLLCDLVEADPGLRFGAYVDALVIATGYRRHHRLLVGADRAEFVRLCEETPLASWKATDRIPWSDLLGLLTRREAVERDGAAIKPGWALAVVRGRYPAVAASLIDLLRKAASYLRELQECGRS